MAGLYTIHVLNFSKHNSGIKKGYKKTMIANTFCSDSKLGVVPLTVRWMFLGIILTCGDMTRDTIEMNERQLRDLLESSWSIDRALSALQSLQLLTYTKIDLFINRIEDKVIEDKVIEVTERLKKPALKNPEDSQNNKLIWQEYFTAYRLRYSVDPVRNAQVNSQISNLRKKLGVDEALLVVKFYLTHNDSWYLKKTHEFGLCLKDAETLRTQMLRGKQITGSMVRSFEKTVQQKEYDEQLKNLWSTDDVNK